MSRCTTDSTPSPLPLPQRPRVRHIAETPAARRAVAWAVGLGLLAGLLMVWPAAAQPVASAPALVTGSVERGRAVYQAECSMCHHPDRHLDGPRHRGVLGRRAGALQDYDYSPALRNSRVLWTRATLTAWLTDPEALIPGQLMDVRLESAQDREDVVAYLATLRDPARTPPQ